MQSLNNLTFVIPIKNEVLNPSIFISFVELMYKDFELIFVYDDDDERALTELEPLRLFYQLALLTLHQDC